MGDKHFSLPGVLNDILRLVDSGETTAVGGKPFNLFEFVGFRPKAIKGGRKTIATTGVAVALPAGKLFNGVRVTAGATNAGTIWIGGQGVVTTDTDVACNGYPLAPGDEWSISTDDLSRIYINGTAGDFVRYSGN